jgi:hypothetical protein
VNPFAQQENFSRQPNPRHMKMTSFEPEFTIEEEIAECSSDGESSREKPKIQIDDLEIEEFDEFDEINIKGVEEVKRDLIINIDSAPN